MLNKADNKSSSWTATVYTLIAQSIFLLLTLYINYWITKHWAVEGFAAYNLIKRLGTFLLFPILLGMGIGIPKFISLQKKVKDQAGYEYLLAACLLFLISFIVLAIGLSLVPNLLLNSFDLPASDFGLLLAAILLFTFSQGLFQLITAYYRGKLEFGASSSLHLIVMSALPLGILFVSADVYLYMQKYSLISCLILMGLILLPWKKLKTRKANIKLKMQRLLKFGLPRVPGELSLFGLEFLPIFAASVFVGLKESGYIAMSFLLIKLVTVPFELYGNVMLPYIGKEMASGNQASILKWVRGIQIRCVGLSMLGFAIAYFITPPLINTFYPELAPSIVPTQHLFAIMPFYVNYLLLRNVIDLLHQRAYNSINLLIALTVQIALLSLGFYLKEAIYYQVLAIAIPFVLLGCLSEWTWYKSRKKVALNK